MKREALHPQSQTCILIGNTENEKGYTLLDPFTLRTYIESKVQFEEGPFQDIQHDEVEFSTPHPPLDDEKDSESYTHESLDFDSDDSDDSDDLDDSYIDSIDQRYQTLIPKWD